MRANKQNNTKKKWKIIIRWVSNNKKKTKTLKKNFVKKKKKEIKKNIDKYCEERNLPPSLPSLPPPTPSRKNPQPTCTWNRFDNPPIDLYLHIAAFLCVCVCVFGWFQHLSEDVAKQQQQQQQQQKRKLEKKIYWKNSLCQSIKITTLKKDEKKNQEKKWMERK